MAKEKILLSACLAGVKCVYDGTDKLKPALARLYRNKEAIIFCPEKAGGFKIPHPPSEILGASGEDVLENKAQVVSKNGKDVTVYFLKGAKKVLALAKKKGIKQAVMKARSPSCGCGLIYDGSFSGKLVKGYGVTAALLKKNGIKVMSDEEYLKNAKIQQE